MGQTAVKMTIVVPSDVAAQLDAYASRERRSRSNAASVLLEEALLHDGQADREGV